MVYSFQATVVARDYHVYKNVKRDQAKVGDKVLFEIESDKKSKEIDPHCCSIRTSVNQEIKTVGHIPRDISWHVYFFLKDEHAHIDGTVKSTDGGPSPIPAGGLKIPLTLNFKCPRYFTNTKMKEFMSTLYSFITMETKNERDESSSDVQINLLINELSEESQSDSEVVLETRTKRKAPLISEFSAESQTDSEVVNPKRKEKQPLINKTPKFESDSEVVNPKRKTKLFLINETQEDDRFVIDKEYDIVIE